MRRKTTVIPILLIITLFLLLVLADILISLNKWLAILPIGICIFAVISLLIKFSNKKSTKNN